MGTKWTIDDLKIAAKDSQSVRAVVKKLGLNQDCGSNITRIREELAKHKINTSHFLGQAIWKGKTLPCRTVRPWKAILVKDSPYDIRGYKARLIREGILKNECYLCNLKPLWQGEKLTLVLDHINGINTDNRKDNLRLLCPNCNSQTPTFTGRNVGTGVKSNNNKGNRITGITGDRLKKIRKDKKGKKKKCPQCKKSRHMRSSQKYCSNECKDRANRKVRRPTKESLEKVLTNNSILAASKIYGVSDNAIRKWLKNYGLLEKYRRYSLKDK